MLFNFCESRLRPEIHCSTISTEGHEVANLISNSDKGFLAYSCIKPPINIDITFLCNIRINHILIWPYVGSQKSSGFQLYAKTSNDDSVPYTLLCSGYLDRSDSGMLFYSSNVNHETIPAPSNFVKRYIKSSMQYLTTYISNLRICICKTENSVPAMGRIEVWGTVSPRCGKDTVASVQTLWSKDQMPLEEPGVKIKKVVPPVAIANDRKQSGSSLQIPDCYLDAITCEIMTQPIMLPSGKIIDQSTLERHEETEALWGRSITDPFTGLPFSEHRKPVIATALKLRIDKFLLENSNVTEIKNLPRVLGRALPPTTREKISEIPKYSLKENLLIKTSSDSKAKTNSSPMSVQKDKKYCHKLPVSIVSSKQSVGELTRPIKRRKITSSIVSACNKIQDEQDSSSSRDIVNVNIASVEFDVATIAPNLKRFNVTTEKEETSCTKNTCTCCSNGIFYELPCKHVLCRKVLTSIENNRCTVCSTSYATSEVKRIYN